MSSLLDQFTTRCAAFLGRPVLTRTVVATSLLVAATGAAQSSGLIIFGIKEEGGGLDGFEKVIDFETGKERIVEMQGASVGERGFDGQHWIIFNGTQVVVDLPSEVADRNAEKWLGQNIPKLAARGGNKSLTLRPPGASAVTVEFDPVSKRPTQAVIESDYGPIRMTYSDWQEIGNVRYPRLTEKLTETGERTLLRAASVRYIKSIDPQLLVRPNAAITRARLPKDVVVPFRTSGRGTHMLVDAVVDGQSGEFVFDTGAANIFTVDAAKARGIAAKGGVNISGVGEGSAGGGFALVRSVSLGDATLSNQSFLIIPPIFPAVNGKPSPTEGLLGFEFFAHFVTTIDYKSKTLTFRENVPTNQSGIKLPFYSDGHSIYAAAKVNGRQGWFRLDTGDGGGVTLFPAFASREGLKADGQSKVADGGGVGGAVKEASGSVNSFEFGRTHFDRHSVRFALNEKGAFASQYLAGNLGGRFLSCFRITLDHDNHQMWLEPQLDTPLCEVSVLNRTEG